MKNEFHGRRSPWGGFAGKSLLTLAFVLCLILTMPLLGNAAGISAGQSCSLTVNAASDEEFQKGLAEAGLVLDLYKVADAFPTTEGSGYSYGVLSEYGGLKIAENMSSDQWRALSQSAADIVLNSEAGGKTLVKEGIDIKDSPIKGLDPGIYLLIVRKAGEEDYVSVTDDGDIVTKVDTDGYTYTFLPELVAVPGQGSVKDEWEYDVEIFLKPQRDTGVGSLKIKKVLQGEDAGSGPVTFVFDVEALLDGKKVYSNVVSMAFDGAGEEEIIIEDLPIGAEVTVTEVYSGPRCRLITDKTQTVKIESHEDVPFVSFTNEYDGRRNNGESITNHFRYSETDGWQLEQIINKSQG